MKVLLICPSIRPAVPQLAEKSPLALAPILGEYVVSHWIEYAVGLGARDVQVMGKGGACDISKTVLRYNGTHYVTGKSDPVAWCSEGSQ